MTVKFMYFKYFQLISKNLIEAVACICVCMHSQSVALGLVHCDVTSQLPPPFWKHNIVNGSVLVIVY